MMIIVINILIERFSIAAPVVSVIGLCDAILYKAAVLVFKLHLMTQISFSNIFSNIFFQITSHDTNIYSNYATDRLSDRMIRNTLHRCGRSSLSRPPLGRRSLVWRYISSFFSLLFLAWRIFSVQEFICNYIHLSFIDNYCTLKKSTLKVRAFARDLVGGLSSCLVNVNSQMLANVKTKLAIQFSRQLLRRTTVNHLVTIEIIEIILTITIIFMRV